MADGNVAFDLSALTGTTDDELGSYLATSCGSCPAGKP